MLERSSKEMIGVRPIQYTKWHNPNPFDQKVVIRTEDGPELFHVPPGETRELPSKFDRTIQMVDCGREECRRNGAYFCFRGHEGQVVGGHAPLLKRVGLNDTVDDSLDPSLVAKRELQKKIDAERAIEAARVEQRAELEAAAAAAAKPIAQPAPQNKGRA